MEHGLICANRQYSILKFTYNLKKYETIISITVYI